jgi:hypothetical protein
MKTNAGIKNKHQQKAGVVMGLGIRGILKILKYLYKK